MFQGPYLNFFIQSESIYRWTNRARKDGQAIWVCFSILRVEIKIDIL